MSEKKTIDCRGLACPQPVINTKQALAGAVGPFLVMVDNPGSCTNVQRFAESQGARVSVEEVGGDFHLTIEPGRAAGQAVSAESIAVYVSSETLGRGDDQLGAVLMAAFLDTLSQFKGQISHAVFLNSGAKLAVEGSPVLDQLRQLEQVGVQILVCGTCLNHFGIQDRLAVGSVSNMYAIIEVLSSAAKIIRP